MSAKTAIMFLKGRDFIWQFLELKEVLRMSITCRFCANLYISQDNMFAFLGHHHKLKEIGQFKISFASEITIGILRRLLNRVIHGRKGLVSIDGSGRLRMTSGASLKRTDSSDLEENLISVIDEVTPIKQEESEVGTDDLARLNPILEAYSCDEFDDFVPTHPALKVNEKGMSYFSSSDFEDFAKETFTREHLVCQGNPLSELEVWALNSASQVDHSTSRGSLSSFTSQGDLNSNTNLENLDLNQTEELLLQASIRGVSTSKYSDSDNDSDDEQDEGDIEGIYDQIISD